MSTFKHICGGSDAVTDAYVFEIFGPLVGHARCARQVSLCRQTLQRPTGCTRAALGVRRGRWSVTAWLVLFSGGRFCVSEVPSGLVLPGGRSGTLLSDQTQNQVRLPLSRVSATGLVARLRYRCRWTGLQ